MLVQQYCGQRSDCIYRCLKCNHCNINAVTMPSLDCLALTTQFPPLKRWIAIYRKAIEINRSNVLGVSYRFYLFPPIALDTLSPDLQMYWENSMVHPYFDNTTKRDVTAIAGQTCQLHCRVKSLGDRAVSVLLLFRHDFPIRSAIT